MLILYNVWKEIKSSFFSRTQKATRKIFRKEIKLIIRL